MLVGMRALLAVVFAALLLGVSACGSSPAGVKDDGAKKRAEAEKFSTPVETVRLAYETTARAQSSKFSTRSVISGLPQQGMPQSMTITGEGAGKLDGKNARMVVRMPMFGEMEVRYVGSTVYQKMPESFAAEMTSGKQWIEIDYEKMMREEYGASLSEMQGGMQGAPADQLAYLKGVSDSVKEVGTEEVRGAPTTHYRAEVELDKSAPEDPQARRAFEKATENLRAGKVPTEVWIDEKGRVRRYEMTIPVALPEGGSPAAGGDPTMTTTAEYYDFGTPVNVEPPPEDQTIPFENLMELQQQPQATPQPLDSRS